MSAELVLVTGGSGFIGSHCILQLLNKGYRVRTSVRSLQRAPEVREMLSQNGADTGALSFVEADLLSDAGWPEAMAGCKYVLHIASPIPLGLPKNEDELIIPAREGALRVLRAARDADVKRLVLTSSFAAMSSDQVPAGQAYTEKNWSDPNSGLMQPYQKSKTVAELAAWDFITREGNGLELAVVNPVYVFGPVLAADYSPSIEVVRRLLDGAVPGCPRLSFGIVDVRDVADLHLRVMLDPAALGERFLAVTGESMSMLQIARLLKERLGAQAARVPTRALPDWVMRLVGLTDPAIQQMVPELGKSKNVSNKKARTLLGWAPRSREDAILATAESLIRLGLLRKS